MTIDIFGFSNNGQLTGTTTQMTFKDAGLPGAKDDLTLTLNVMKDPGQFKDTGVLVNRNAYVQLDNFQFDTPRFVHTTFLVESYARVVFDLRSDRFAAEDQQISVWDATSVWVYTDEGKDTVLGGKGADRVYSGAGNDRIDGERGADLLFGQAGNDRIWGGSGKDVISGGLGADTLTGGPQWIEKGVADTFVYQSVAESTTNSRDTITDFQVKVDKIDLALIDASTKKVGDQKFVFIGGDKFHKTAGELQVKTVAGNTYVYADINGDAVADFSIKIDGIHKMTAGDFFL